jgi:hypothetical protein
MSIETFLSVVVLIVLSWGCILGVKRGFFVISPKDEEDKTKSFDQMSPTELAIRASIQELGRSTSASRNNLSSMTNLHSSKPPAYMQQFGTNWVIIHMGESSKTVAGQIAGPMQIKNGSWISQYDYNGDVIDKWIDPASIQRQS